ncbi:MAG: polysaccharide biosynthesis/export family protein [Planctomycetes bacterium]|nr:polysaccharide biosynthesis/export family protein [Planctomycetota bacterium]
MGLRLAALGLVALTVPVAAVGCRTSLTTPHTAVVKYINKDGSLREPRRAIAIYATEYMKVLRSLKRDREDRVYFLKPGDLLEVSVVDDKAASWVVSIRPDGPVDLPMAGEVPAAGRSIAEFKQDVVERLRRYYVTPTVVVNLKGTEFKPTVEAGRATVIGITATAPFQISTGGAGSTSVVPLRGNDLLFDVAFGVFQGGSDWEQIATIRRGRGDRNLIIISSLRNFLENAEFDENIPVQDGDYIFAAHKETTWLQELVANLRMVNALTGDVKTLIDNVEGEGD